MNMTQKNSVGTMSTADEINPVKSRMDSNKGVSYQSAIPVLTLDDNSASDRQKLATTTRTTCPYCGVGCGVLATVEPNGQVSVQGDPNHPANFGKLCSKGSALAQTLSTDRRITRPYYQNKQQSMQLHRQLSTSSQQGDAVIQYAEWDTVLDDVASRLKDTIDKYGRDSVMFYVSGQLLTEDYYVANKLIKGFIGNNNIDSNSRLCMSSAVAGHKRAFGADLVPGNYQDFETCDLLVLVGSNMAWCHPILFGRFLKAKRENPNKKLVVIDPRRTDSCEFADLHLPIAPGTDTHLYNGLLHYLDTHGCRDNDYAAQCAGLDEALAAASDWSIEAVAKATQLDAEKIEQFYQLVAENNKTVTAFSMGVNQSSSGTDKVNAIINTHLLTGRVGLEGASPFSLTGQPNAMGGREVGALANLLAAHLDLDNPNHRQMVEGFWQAPESINPHVGVKACDAADAILDGRIKAIWIMATNPVVSLPEADKFRRALAECDLVIVSECSKDSDTVRCADIVLPAQGWGEKSGTVTNSERRISRQRSFLPAVGNAKADWWIMSQVAQRMGFSGFDYAQPSDIFNEHMALTAYQNKSTDDHSEDNSDDSYSRHLNISSGLNSLFEHKNGERKTSSNVLTAYQYDDLTPFQWGGSRIDMMDKAAPHHRPAMVSVIPPLAASAVNRFSRKQGVRTHQKNENASKIFLKPESGVSDQTADNNKPISLDMRLITGRLRDQWHTMTRTGLAAQLNQQQTVPTVTLHSQDAKKLGITDKDFVVLAAQQPFDDAIDSGVPDGRTQKQAPVLAQVDVSDDMRIGDAFMPMHWSDAFASLARVGVLIPTKVDPISSQPELKNSAITIQALPMQSVGHILVHIDWLDAVLVQLRMLMADDDANESINDSTSLPNVVWSISRQEACVLISIAIPVQAISELWRTAEYWQSFVDRVAHGLSCSIETKSQALNSDMQAGYGLENKLPDSLSTAVMVNQASQQLRLVVQQDVLNTEGGEDTVQNLLGDVSKPKQMMLSVYIAPEYEQLPSVSWLSACFADLSEVPSVKWLLAGRPAAGYVDPGPLVCSCMGVGENTIIEAITKKSCADAAAVGQACKAGTNCGSCVGQINTLIEAYA